MSFLLRPMIVLGLVEEGLCFLDSWIMEALIHSLHLFPAIKCREIFMSFFKLLRKLSGSLGSPYHDVLDLILAFYFVDGILQAK